MSISRCLNWIILVGLLCFSWAGFSMPPPASDVFKLSTHVVNGHAIKLHWMIQPGFFLYQERIKIEPENATWVEKKPLYFPNGEVRKDAQGHLESIYRRELTLNVSLSAKHAGQAPLLIYYQGCSDQGFCYPPQIKKIRLQWDEALHLTKIKPFYSQMQRYAQLFYSKHWTMIILSFLGFGLLLSFTPCVLPMIPVLSGLIIGHGEHLNHRKSILLSISYVLGMSLTYAILGALFALIGKNLQVVMQSSWMIGGLSVLFILLALSMFNVYTLKLPVSWQSRLAQVTRSQANGHLLGALVMGGLSTLVLSPCVTAPLLGVLSYLAHTGDMLLGATALFFLGLGMGIPLLLIGFSAGKLLPRVGRWMNLVQAFFGILLLGVAISLLQRILPGLLIMGLWAVLLVCTGIFLATLTSVTGVMKKITQGMGLMLLVYGLLVLIGASMGSRDVLQPLQGPVNLSNDERQSNTTVTNLSDMQQALLEAKKTHTPVLVDFYANWCTSCKVMNRTIQHNRPVQRLLKNRRLITVDLSANDADAAALLQYYHVVAPPTFLFFNAEGQEVSRLRLVGEVSMGILAHHLEAATDAPN